MSHDPLYPDATVAELQDFIIRAKQALSEARRPDLAARCALLIREDGRATLFFPNFSNAYFDGTDGQEVLQFLRLDPMYEFAHAEDTL